MLSQTFAPGVAFANGGGLTADGLIGGVQAGYNWQVNTLVFGIKGDISFADVELRNGHERNVRATATLDDAWVIRARAEFHF